MTTTEVPREDDPVGRPRRGADQGHRRQPGEVSAEALAVLVARDEKTGASRVISDAERGAFERAAVKT